MTIGNITAKEETEKEIEKNNPQRNCSHLSEGKLREEKASQDGKRLTDRAGGWDPPSEAFGH